MLIQLTGRYVAIVHDQVNFESTNEIYRSSQICFASI